MFLLAYIGSSHFLGFKILNLTIYFFFFFGGGWGSEK